MNFCGSMRMKIADSFLAKDMSFLKQALASSDVADGFRYASLLIAVMETGLLDLTLE